MFESLHIHPPLSGMPLAFFLLALLLELFSFCRANTTSAAAARLVFYAACVSVLAAYLSGQHAEDHASQIVVVSSEVITRHQFWGKALLVACAATLCLERAAHIAVSDRRRLFERVYQLMLILCFLFAVKTSTLGGELVFDYGAGVRLQKVPVELRP